MVDDRHRTRNKGLTANLARQKKHSVLKLIPAWILLHIQNLVFLQVSAVSRWDETSDADNQSQTTTLTLKSPLVLTHAIHRTGDGAVLLSITVENRSDRQLVLSNHRLVTIAPLDDSEEQPSLDNVTLAPVFNKTKSVGA